MLPTSHPDFVPPFCPRPSCVHHRDPSGWTFHRDGTHQREAEPRVIRRFRCTSCGRCFSTQTFDTTYWLKRPDLQKPLFNGIVACSGFRQLGRSLNVAASSLQRQTSRLGRHCLLFNELHRPTGPPSEPLVLDGLLSFEYSQYWPFETNVIVGKESYFTYGFTDSELRRSGTMRPDQKARRERLERVHGKPDPRATRKAVEALVRLVIPEPASKDGRGLAITLLTDMHRAYPRALARLPHAITHLTVTSRRCRTRRNPMHAVDHFDLLVRHSSANHKRETLAFSKRRQGSHERMAVMITWRNFVKRKSERRRDSLTPAQLLGLTKERMSIEDILIRRLFPSQVSLPSPHDDYYWRRIPTRQVPDGTTHRLEYAA